MRFTLLSDIDEIETIATNRGIREIERLRKQYGPGRRRKRNMNAQPIPTMRFAICIQNTDYPAALEVRKIYQVLPDDDAAVLHYVRVIDESGDDYLYPADYFLMIDLPQPVQEAILRAA